MSVVSASNPIAPEAKLGVLFGLAWPMILGRSSQAVVGFSDAAMTAPLGEAQLAAVTTGAMNVFSLAILPMGIVFIVQSFASQLTGAGDHVGARRYAYYGLILSALAGLLSFIAIPFLPELLSVFEYEADVAGSMTDYLEIRLIAIFAIVGVEAIGNWFGGLGKTKPHMTAGLLAMVINVPLNWLLIEGNLGAPALGVKGAAWASVIASMIAFAYLLIVFVAARSKERPGKLRLSEFKRVIRFGFPNGLSWFLEFAAFTVFTNVVVAHLGTTVIAAMMAVFTMNSVSFMPAFALSSAGAILVGQAIGAGKKESVGSIVWLVMRVCAVWQCSVGLLYLLVPETIMSVFGSKEVGVDQLVAIGAGLLALSAAWQLFDAAAMAVSETLRAAGDTKWCLWARIILAWVFFVPVSVLTVFVFDGGYLAAMGSIIGYIALVAVVFVWRFRSGKWKDIDLTGDEEVLPIAVAVETGDKPVKSVGSVDEPDNEPNESSA